MTEQFDYTQYQDPEAIAQASGDILSQLSNLALEQKGLELELARKEAEVKETKVQLRRMSEDTIPDIMEEAGVEEFTTTAGIKITIKDKWRAKIPKASEEKAFAWLEENGFERLIKREFHILFNKEEDKWADKFERDCAQRKKPLRLDRKKNVHHSTLAAFVKEQVDEGEAIPLDLFGAFRQRYSNITITNN